MRALLHPFDTVFLGVEGVQQGGKTRHFPPDGGEAVLGDGDKTEVQGRAVGMQQQIGLAVFAAENGGSILVTTDPREAVADADCIFTDTWVSMGEEAEYAIRSKPFRDYQVNDELMALAKPDALFQHCLPAHRGKEVTASVIDGPQSVVWDEAENRLHAQKALLTWLIGQQRGDESLLA